MNQNIEVNLIPNSFINSTMRLSQYDIGRVATITVKHGNDDYQIPSGATVKIQATKPSGLGFSVECTYTNNVVTVVTVEGMTDEFGAIPAELSITSGDTLLGTANFIFDVEKSPHPEGITDGSADAIIDEMTQLINNFENVTVPEAEQQLQDIIEQGIDVPIKVVKVNGEPLAITDESVNVVMPTVDNAMSDASENAVQNKAVKAYVDAHTGTISATSDGAGTVTIEMV